MIGYHGTSRKFATAIIESQEFSFNKFIITSDLVVKRGQRMPNDFGNGIYMFIDSGYYNGKDCARKYANTFKERPSSVLEIQIKDEISVIDFQDDTTKKVFIELREKIIDKIYYNYQRFVNEGGSKQRANLDGFIIEFIIQYKFKNKIDAVMGESYTPFYNPERSISNFPNGKELCLRNSNSICWELCKEVEL